MNAKKGLAFVTTSPTDAKVDSVLLGGKQGAAWYYSWRPVSPVADAHGAEFVPMLWDASQANWTALQANYPCLLYTSPSPRDRTRSRMPSSA